MLVDTPVCDFGWKMPHFSLKSPDGSRFDSTEDLNQAPLLIMFICNHCPYVKRIAEDLAKRTELLMKEGIQVVAIMSNDYREYPEDAPEKMLSFKQDHGFQFPYLLDEDQSVGKAFGAVCTPDFFGFNSRGELQFRGNSEEMGQAMMLILKTGKGPDQQTPSMGCSIKWSTGG